MKTVRIHDPHTGNITRIPVSELSLGYMKFDVIGMEEPLFVRLDMVEASTEFIHPPFDAKLRARMEEFAKTFGDVYPITADQWEEGFRQDNNPASEIAIWGLIQDEFRHFTEGKKLPQAARQDYYNVILSVFNNGPDAALEVVRLMKVTKRRAQSVVARLTHKFRLA